MGEASGKNVCDSVLVSLYMCDSEMTSSSRALTSFTFHVFLLLGSLLLFYKKIDQN